MSSRKAMVVTCDAGGTMTDVFIVDPEGNFSVGKASTTPADESVGFWSSLCNALLYWGIDAAEHPEEVLKDTSFAVYSGTTLVNALIQRKGQKVGLIVTKGFEDILIQERGVQAWVGYSYADRFHKVTHTHNPSLVPRRLIRGVTERIDLFGNIVIPLYGEEVRTAVRELLSEGVDSIAVMFLWSFMNNSHEAMAAEIAGSVMKDVDRMVPLHLSHEVAPIFMEHSRTNCTVIQAYSTDLVRNSLFNIENKLKSHGLHANLYTITASGGLVDIRYPRLVETVVSGPIGGLMGAKYLAAATELGDSIVATDLGGTSFDMGIISGGLPFTDREVHVARFILNLPILTMDNIGAGLGMYITVDPTRKRMKFGPESAGANPGPACYDMGNEIPTLADAHLVLGHINPEYYLGGQLKLNTSKAFSAMKKYVSDPLGMDVHAAAEGALRLLNARLRDSLRTILMSRGLHPADYYHISYGGAGPMEMAFYTDGLPFKGVFTVPWAAAFSAFGLMTDYAHRYQRSTMLVIPPDGDDQAKLQVGEQLNSLWEELENKARQELEEIGHSWSDVTVQPLAYLRYGGQLHDVETLSPVKRIQRPEDLDALINAFENLYERAYTRVAKHSEAGYMILNVGLVTETPLPKPKIQRYALEGGATTPEANKGSRSIYLDGKQVVAKVYEMDLLRPGNQIQSPALIEAPNTTLILPHGKSAYMDEWRRIWIR